MPPDIIQCGAYYAHRVAQRARAAPERTIWIFDPLLARLLVREDWQRLKREHPNVVLRDEAVWVSDGLKAFWVDRKDGIGSTFYRHKTTGELGDPAVAVRTIDLARFMRENVKDKCILRMDIEGAEYEVLPHLLATGAAALIAQLVVEWHGKRIGMMTGEEQRARGAIVDGLEKLGVKISRER